MTRAADNRGGSAGAPEGAADAGAVAMAVDKVLPARTAREVVEEWHPKLDAIRDAWEATLPPEAAETWTQGAAYVRESNLASLAGDAPDTQLRNLLTLLAQKHVFVARGAVYFDVESATDIGPRTAFKRLYERAVAGGYKVVGVFVGERLFRNVEQAKAYKRQFRLKGVELVYFGMFEGDKRNPAAWHFETMQDASAELHARTTSYYVGMHFEQITRFGRPVGRIPEVYRVKERMPAFLGRRGSVVSWEVVEPLGSILREGCHRYLAGASMSDLATWSGTTELHGVTPAGRVMDRRWWYSVLTNPKFAGYQMPTTYMGFKPGVESPKRPRRTGESELVPCLLPALWTLEDYRAVLRTARARWVGTKRRRTYKTYLLSGVAVDARCGHPMKIEQTGPDGHYWMQCKEYDLTGRHSPALRADIAARELDEIVSGIRIEDVELLRQIEDELAELARAERSEQDRFRPNPAIASARQALAGLRDAGLDDMRRALEARITELELADVSRREALSQPLVEFRHALAQLSHWSDVWRDGDLWTKNELLREAGFRVEIGRLPGQKDRTPAHVLSISAENQAVQVALAASGAPESGHCVSRGPCADPIPTALSESTPFGTAARRALCLGAAEVIVLARPTVPAGRGRNNVPPSLPGGPWHSTGQAAAALGLTLSALTSRIRSGSIRAERVVRGRQVWWLIPQAELDRLGAFTARRCPDRVRLVAAPTALAVGSSPRGACGISAT